MAIEMCPRCGFFANQQHDCAELAPLVQPLTAAPEQGEPLAMLPMVTHTEESKPLENACTGDGCRLCTNRVGRFAHLQRAFGRLKAEVQRTAAIPGATARTGEPDQRDPLRFRYNPGTGTFDPPTPAAMLGEALEVLWRAETLVRGAVGSGRLGDLEPVLVAEMFSAMRIRVSDAKREAEAREGRG